jgi:hypothetical protein
MFGLVGMD